MRRVRKGHEPAALRQWKEDNQAVPQNLTFDALHGSVKREIRSQMMQEQGYLCAYTMQRIQTTDDCHIEHLIPQSQAPDLDLDYDNLLACFPGTPTPPQWNPRLPYGAQHKGGRHIDHSNFVSPLSADVEKRFRYTADGAIRAGEADTAALSSIEILKLDHDMLRELRKAAIEERVLDASLTEEEARELAAHISMPDSGGMLPEFCLAIAQVSEWYAKALQAQVKTRSQAHTPPPTTPRK